MIAFPNLTDTGRRVFSLMLLSALGVGLLGCPSGGSEAPALDPAPDPALNPALNPAPNNASAEPPSAPEVTFEPAYPVEVSTDALDEEDIAQQEQSHSHGEDEHSHGEDDHPEKEEEDHDH